MIKAFATTVYELDFSGAGKDFFDPEWKKGGDLQRFFRGEPTSGR